MVSGLIISTAGAALYMKLVIFKNLCVKSEVCFFVLAVFWYIIDFLGEYYIFVAFISVYIGGERKKHNNRMNIL